MSQRVEILDQRAEPQHLFVQGGKALRRWLRNLVDELFEIPLQDRDRSPDFMSQIADQASARAPFAFQRVSHPVERTGQLTELARSVLRLGSGAKVASLEPSCGRNDAPQRSRHRPRDERRAEKGDRDR